MPMFISIQVDGITQTIVLFGDMLERAKDMTPAFNDIGALMVEALSVKIGEKNIGESSDGAGWEDLKEKYKKEKIKYKGTIYPFLVYGKRTSGGGTQLKTSIQHAQPKITKSSATVSTNVPYAKIHNYGGRTKLRGRSVIIPRREFMYLTPAEFENCKKILEKYILEGKTT